jgi:flagellar motility protein MotE (MotC chaperone)
VKNLIVYAAIFLFAFALVTGALFFLNSQYKNIFAFDFTPETHQPAKVEPKENSENNVAVSDTTKADSTAVVHDSTLVAQDTVKTAKEPEIKAVKDQKLVAEVKPVQQKQPEKAPVTENPMVPKTNSKQSASKKDSVYNSWVTQTVKLYEVMDSKKVAKIILGYSDNIARDLILRMRKKKAAEVLSEFKPEVVTRLISVN